jgi:chromosome segregation ATPase
MIFAAGFLVASLLALLVYPALNRRAERLARRRVEALFPLSITELTAEKDHLRAEFAVTQRRLERKAEEALASRHAFMEEHGRRAMRIQALETDLSARDETLATLGRELADTRQRLGLTEEELEGAKLSLSGARDTLSAIGDAHARTLDELASVRAELAAAAAALAETRTALASAQERLQRREGEYADLASRYSAALGENDTRRITISDLETRLGTQTSRATEFERSLAEARTELVAERQRLADLARNLTAEQGRREGLEQRVRAAEAERDLKGVEAAAVARSLEELRAANDGRAPGDAAEIRAENAELRRRLDEIADRILQAADASGDPPPPGEEADGLGETDDTAAASLPEREAAGDRSRRQRGSRRPATA